MSEKKRQLEEVATESVQRAGLHNLSFRTLADEVGIKSSSVHYYFPEKSNLASALIESYSQTFAQLLGDIERRKLTPKGKIDAFINLFEEVLESDKFCLCGMMAAEVDSLDEDNRTSLASYFQSTEDWLVRVLEEADCELKPRVFARIVLSGLEGAILLDRIDGRRDRLRAHRELVRHLLK